MQANSFHALYPKECSVSNILNDYNNYCSYFDPSVTLFYRGKSDYT